MFRASSRQEPSPLVKQPPVKGVWALGGNPPSSPCQLQTTSFSRILYTHGRRPTCFLLRCEEQTLVTSSPSGVLQARRRSSALTRRSYCQAGILTVEGNVEFYFTGPGMWGGSSHFIRPHKLMRDVSVVSDCLGG